MNRKQFHALFVNIKLKDKQKPHWHLVLRTGQQGHNIINYTKHM